MNAACPACGFRTLSTHRYGSYELCSVCGWEDDAVQLANPACGGGANRDSLIDAQQAALRSHPMKQSEAGPFRRDPMWRPLNPEELDTARREREESDWKNKAEPSKAYWRDTG